MDKRFNVIEGGEEGRMGPDFGSNLRLVSDGEIDLGLSKVHPEFFASLAGVSDEAMIRGLSPRKYQLDATRGIRDGMLSGISRGQLIIGTGGGKTSVAMNFAEQTRGRFLYVAPSRVAIQRAQDEMGKLGMTKTSQRMERGNPFDMDAGVTFTTWQMLLQRDRYMEIPPELFDCCVFDEAHHFLGPEVRKLVGHFNSYQVHMTATPDNATTSVSKAVPYEYFRYSSDDLVSNDGFPAWLLYRHEVENERLNEAEVVGDRFAIQEGSEDRFLNISHRWAICAEILRECLPKREKAIVYLPSVGSSKRFVEEVVARDPVLKGYVDKIVHVDGSMNPRQIRDIERRFRASVDDPNSILAVCGKDLWTESLDVPDIEHVVLADPCASKRVFLQRIGRGARPADDKQHVHIHDVVSTVNRLNVQLAARSKRPVTVAGMMRIEKYYPGIVLNGPYLGMYWDTAGTKVDGGEYRLAPKVNSRVIPFTERNLELNFMQDHRHAYALFEKFAELLSTNVYNLAFYNEELLHREDKMTLRTVTGATFQITFRDFMDAAEFFGTLDYIQQKVIHTSEGLRAEIRRSFSPEMRFAFGMQAEREKEEAIRDYGCEIPKDPFDLSRFEDGTFVCPDDAMRDFWRYVFVKIEEWRRANPGAVMDVLEIPFDEIKKALPRGRKTEGKNYWANPDHHYNGMGDFEEIAALNNITATYSKNGVIVDVEDTRRYWKMAYLDPPAYMVLHRDHFKTVAYSRQGPGFNKYYLQGYGSEVEQGDFLETEESYPYGMIHEDFAKEIIEAIKAGRDYVVVDKDALDNSLELVLCEVFGLMGLSSRNVQKGCGEDREARKGRSWNFVNVVQLPDGRWKVPIGQVKLQLELGSKDPAFNWKKQGGGKLISEEIERSLTAIHFADDVPEGIKKAVEFVIEDIRNTNRDEPDYQCESEAEFSDVEAFCKLYGIELDTKDRKSITDVGYIRMNGGKGVERPMAAKLVKVGGVYKVTRVMQRFPTQIKLDGKLMGQIYDALKGGEKTLNMKFADNGEFHSVVEEIFEAREYLRSFGFKGGILDVIGPASFRGFTLSLEGLAV